MSTPVYLIFQVSVLAYAVLAGVFLAFSDFIMRSLSLSRGAGGVEVMQAINREVFRWVFMAVFMGMAAVSVFIAGYALVSLEGTGGALIAIAGLVYLLGCFGVTIVFNVPMNEALAGMGTDAEATRAYWTGTYLPRWTFWNSIRTAACATSAALLLAGLSLMAGSSPDGA